MVFYNNTLLLVNSIKYREFIEACKLDSDMIVIDNGKSIKKKSTGSGTSSLAYNNLVNDYSADKGKMCLLNSVDDKLSIVLLNTNSKKYYSCTNADRTINLYQENLTLDKAIDLICKSPKLYENYRIEINLSIIPFIFASKASIDMSTVKKTCNINLSRNTMFDAENSINYPTEGYNYDNIEKFIEYSLKRSSNYLIYETNLLILKELIDVAKKREDKVKLTNILINYITNEVMAQRFHAGYKSIFRDSLISKDSELANLVIDAFIAMKKTYDIPAIVYRIVDTSILYNSHNLKRVFLNSLKGKIYHNSEFQALVMDNLDTLRELDLIKKLDANKVMKHFNDDSYRKIYNIPEENENIKMVTELLRYNSNSRSITQILILLFKLISEEEFKSFSENKLLDKLSLLLIRDIYPELSSYCDASIFEILKRYENHINILIDRAITLLSRENANTRKKIYKEAGTRISDNPSSLKNLISNRIISIYEDETNELMTAKDRDVYTRAIMKEVL